MLLALLLAAAEPGSVAAERAFARDAQVMGQWAAFAKWAAPDATMFTPQPTDAQGWLKGRTSPPVAVQWWPADVWLSCDGKTAVHRGPWLRAGGTARGWFTTVWQQTAAGWRWSLDHGDTTAQPLVASDKPVIHRAACSKPDGHNGVSMPIDGVSTTGYAADNSMLWTHLVGADGERYFWVQQWTGRRWKTVLTEHVAGEAT